jgi:hypothetical protein
VLAELLASISADSGVESLADGSLPNHSHFLQNSIIK